MRTARALAVVVLAACFSPAGPPAHAADPAGLTCGFTTLHNRLPGAGPDEYMGEIDGGPVAAADLTDLAADPVSVTITCALQVGGTGTYAEPDDVSASATGSVVTYLPPTPMSYVRPPHVWVWLCTTWTVTDAHGTTATYYDDSTGEFSTDPTTAHCSLPTGDQKPAQEICDLAWPVCWFQAASDENGR